MTQICEILWPTIFLLLLLLVEMREEVGKEVLRQDAYIASDVVIKDEPRVDGWLVEPPTPPTPASDGPRGHVLRRESHCSHGEAIVRENEGGKGLLFLFCCFLSVRFKS